jgi:hypothetical protein
VESVGIILGLVITLGLYLRDRKATRRLFAAQDARITELTDDLGSLRMAMVDAGAAERGAQLPPPPSVAKAPAFPRSPGGLPLRPVSITRDDDPSHTRATVVAPPPEGEVAPVSGTLPKCTHRSPLPPHPINAPSSRRTLLGGIAGALVVPLNTRTAHRIDVLFWTKLTLAAKEGAKAAHCEGPLCDGTIAICNCPCDSCDLRRALHAQATVELTGPQTAAELAAQARAQRKPATISQRIERRWHEKIAARHEAGQDVRHCYGVGCMEEGEGIALCECPCDGCAIVRDLLTQAMREVAGGG